MTWKKQSLQKKRELIAAQLAMYDETFNLNNNMNEKLKAKQGNNAAPFGESPATTDALTLAMNAPAAEWKQETADYLKMEKDETALLQFLGMETIHIPDQTTGEIKALEVARFDAFFPDYQLRKHVLSGDTVIMKRMREAVPGSIYRFFCAGMGGERPNEYRNYRIDKWINNPLLSTKQEATTA